MRIQTCVYGGRRGCDPSEHRTPCAHNTTKTRTQSSLGSNFPKIPAQSGHQSCPSITETGCIVPLAIYRMDRSNKLELVHRNKRAYNTCNSAHRLLLNQNYCRPWSCEVQLTKHRQYAQARLPEQDRPSFKFAMRSNHSSESKQALDRSTSSSDPARSMQIDLPIPNLASAISRPAAAKACRRREGPS